MSIRDFRATQVRTHAIIGSGSAPQLLLYPSASATNQYGGVNLPGTGSDTWMFVSGAIGTTSGKVVFGGDVIISGSVNAIGGGTAGTNFFSSTTTGALFTTGSAAFRGGESSIDDPADKGSDVFFYVSGTVGGTASLSKKSLFGGDVVSSGSITASGITGSNLSVSGDTVIGGNLTVNGTTTTVNTTNLVVRDPIVLIGSGSVGTNRNGGIALASGSATANKSLVFGRVANDTWGVGKLDVLNGTSTSLAGMDLVGIRAGTFEVATSGYLTGTFGNIQLAAGAGSVNVSAATTISLTATENLEQTFSGSYSIFNSIDTDPVKYLFKITDPLDSFRPKVEIGSPEFDSAQLYVNGNQFVSGFITASLGFSGSHTRLKDGRSFLVAGTNVTIVSASDGQITISSTGGGGDTFFSSVTNGEIFTTGSIVTSGTFAIKDGTGTPRFRVSTTGNAWITGSLALTGTLSVGTGIIASGRDSFAHGSGVTASGLGSHAQGLNSNASGQFSHAEGISSATATYAHAEGSGLASALGSHAEGFFTVANGNYSHAEGWNTRTTRDGSHSEGYLTTGSGFYSHAEGSGSIAFGSASHAGGIYTIASGSGQTVYGQFNLRGNASSLFVIGNGTGDANANRSDVLRVESTGLQVTGSGWFSTGISGSHTSLTDGRSFLVAGANVTITSASDGQITIASTGGSGSPGGTDTQVQFNDGGSTFGGDSGLTYTKGTDTLNAKNLSITATNDFVWNLKDNSAGALNISAGTSNNRWTFNTGDGQEFLGFWDGVRAAFGDINDPDLSIQHDGTNSRIDNKTGRLIISGTNGILLAGPSVQVSGSSGITGSLVIQSDLSSVSQLTLSSSSGFATFTETQGGDLEVRNTKLGGNMTLGVKTSAGNAVNFMTVRPNGAAVSTLVSILPSIYAGPANPINSSDTNFFVGGTVGSRGGANRGTAVFGGDLVISGTVYTPTGLSVTGSITVQGDILPDGDRVQNLGSPTQRWAHVYTGDLHLRNDRGDYTLIEEEEFLSIRFNKTGKRYRFLLEPVPHLDEDPNNLS